MNRCTYFDEILQQRVSSQPPDGRHPKNCNCIKVQGYMILGCFSVCLMLRLPAEST